MKSLKQSSTVRRTLLCAALAAGGFGPDAFGAELTLIEMGDLHGTLVSHAAVLKDADTGADYPVEESGGLARLKHLADTIKEQNPGNVLALSAGDITHGSAEALFTVGDAMMVGVNALGIDVFTPGNWDYGYGPAVFRGRFANDGQGLPLPPVPANIAVMSQQISCADIPVIAGLTDAGDYCMERSANPGIPGSGVIKANFPVVAANVYNDAPIPNHKRIMDPYKIIPLANGVKVAVIGLSAAIVPQQADVFNIGLRFTQGVEELPGLLKEVKDKGADIVVVQSELGQSQDLYLAQHFKDIDVMYSAHTHEVTLGALLADGDKVVRTTPGAALSGEESAMLNNGAAIVLETNRDMYVGRLDLTVEGGVVTDFQWQAIPTTGEEDEDMKALVDWIEAPFLSGDDFKPHTFMPGGYCTDPNSTPQNPVPDDCGDITEHGLQLVDGLDTVVGHTDTLLLRHHVLEDTLNNFIADAIRAVTGPAVANSGIPGWEGGVDISMANGFRFGNAVLPGQDITLRDLYTWFPIGPAVNVGDFSGQSIQKSLDTVLGAVFDRNPFMQRGGWYIGLSGMTQTLDLKNRPFSSSGGRIVQTMIGDRPLTLGKRYVFASCYGHGNPLDEVCRTSGGANFRYFALAHGDKYNSKLTLVDPQPLDVEVITGPIVHQLAPDNYLHPVHALRRYLDVNNHYLDKEYKSDDGKWLGLVTAAQFGPGRVVTVDSTKQPNAPGYFESLEAQAFQPDNTPDPTFVQPPFGAGPNFLSGVAGDR
jgi:2',3'-cyclic-nucleotide 2'-phosphodiesterase (5'-nucleotidase family)